MCQGHFYTCHSTCHCHSLSHSPHDCHFHTRHMTPLSSLCLAFVTRLSHLHSSCVTQLPLRHLSNVTPLSYGITGIGALAWCHDCHATLIIHHTTVISMVVVLYSKSNSFSRVHNLIYSDFMLCTNVGRVRLECY